MKLRLHLQQFLLWLVVPISHKTIGIFYCPLNLEEERAVSPRLPLPSHCPPLYLYTIWPLQLPGSLVLIHLVTAISFQTG